MPHHKGVEPLKRGFRAGYKYVAIILGCAAVLGVVGYLLLTSRAPPTAVSGRIRVGENMTYGVYAGGNKLGTMVYWVEGMGNFDNVECYVARYSLTIGNETQAARMSFDEGGRLRHIKVAVADNEGLEWTTEIGYSFALGVMRVIMEDNRVPENYLVSDNAVVLRGETITSGYLWYLLRIDNLYSGYQRGFYINFLPAGTTVMHASATVTGEETVKTPAGSFDCWALQCENTTNNLWVAKDGRLVAKAIEQVGGATWTYVIESYT